MVILSPVGLSGAPVANQLSVMATFKEKLCNPVFANDSNKPNATVKYSAGDPILEGETVFVPITAAIQIFTPNPNCCKATPQMITEKFMVAFQGRTTLPTSAPVITSVGTYQGVACVNCGNTRDYIINDSLTIAIGASSTAS